MKRHELLRRIARTARRQGVEPGAAGLQPRGLALRNHARPGPAPRRHWASARQGDLRGARGRAWEGLVAKMRLSYRATARRDGRWWFVEVPGEQGLYTQVRRLDQAEAMIREVISLVREVPQDSFDLVVDPDLESLGAVREAVEAALRERERASAAQEAASTAMRHAVSEVRASGYTSRDAGMLLGVSNQRISQIERRPADSSVRDEVLPD